MFDRKTIISLALVAVVILGGLLYFNSLNKNLYDWSESYKVDSDQPYGGYAMYELMKNTFSDYQFKDIGSLKDELPETTDNPATYVFLGYGMYLDSIRAEKLLDFVGNGNNAFIMARYLPADFISDFLAFEDCDLNYNRSYSIYNDSTVNAKLIHPKLKNTTSFTHKYRHKTRSRNWEYINWSDYCYDEIPDYLELGFMNDSLANFIRIPHGNGYFYLHSTPIMFSNINLIEEGKRDYVEKVLGHIEDGDIYWDKENPIGGIPSRIDETGGTVNTGADLTDKTPLQFILSQRSLAWAWYLLLASGLLYLMFRAKRRQRIIPVLEPNVNTSLEFVETIGMLHWQQNDHRQLAMQQMRLFANHVNARYHIPIKNMADVNEKMTKRLASVTDIPEVHFEKIFKEYQNIESKSAISEKELVNFHQLMEYFYNHRK